MLYICEEYDVAYIRGLCHGYGCVVTKRPGTAVSAMSKKTAFIQDIDACGMKWLAYIERLPCWIVQPLKLVVEETQQTIENVRGIRGIIEERPSETRCAFSGESNSWKWRLQVGQVRQAHH